MKNEAVVGIVSILFLVNIGYYAPSISVPSAPLIRLYVDRPVILDSSLVAGTQFSISVRVENVENLWAYAFWLSFNPEVLHGVSVENGPFLGKDTHPINHPVMVAPGPGFDNEVGELKLFGALIYFEGGTYPVQDKYLADGSGVLATVTFEVVGTGASNITLGSSEWTGDDYLGAPYLANKTLGFHGSNFQLRNSVTGEYQNCSGWIWEWIFPWGWRRIPNEAWLDILSEGRGFFSNEPAPELYVRKRGGHGTSGVWPEWHVGLSSWEQTLYCDIMNYGEMGAYVDVEFIVRSEMTGTESYWSEQVWIDAATWVDDDIVPAKVTVSTSFTPEVAGKYWICSILYFRISGMIQKTRYFLVQDTLGGEGISRDVNVAFKVQEHV